MAPIVRVRARPIDPYYSGHPHYIEHGSFPHNSGVCEGGTTAVHDKQCVSPVGCAVLAEACAPRRLAVKVHITGRVQHLLLCTAYCVCMQQPKRILKQETNAVQYLFSCVIFHLARCHKREGNIFKKEQQSNAKTTSKIVTKIQTRKNRKKQAPKKNEKRGRYALQTKKMTGRNRKM